MKRTWRGVVGTVAAVAALSAPGALRAEPSSPPLGTLVITAHGFKGVQGQALIALYATKDTWLKPARAYRLTSARITSASVTVSFTDVPLGTYAVSVIHDANMNGKIDMHWFPIPGPDEGAGTSNDAKALLGPPSFADARFQLTEPRSAIAISVRY